MALKLIGIDQKKLVTELRSNDAGLKNIRSPYIQTWTDIRDFLAPKTARFDDSEQAQAERQDLNIINTSPRFAVRTLPSGMQSGVTNPMRPWFRLGTPDPDLENFKPVKIWLAEVERLMRMAMSRSNLYDRLKSNYGILGTYGTSCFFIDEDEEDIIRGYDFAMGSWAVGQDYRGRVNTMHRDLFLTTSQWVGRFGLDNVPDNVKTAYDAGNYQNKFPITHVVEPNRNFKPGSALSHHKLWASIWMQMGKNETSIISYKGYDSQPMFGPRWDLVGEDVYGIGNGEVALGDAKQLQLQEKRGLQALDKFTNPTMVADGSLRGQRTTNLPGETTYINGLVNGRSGYFPAYQINNPNIDQIEAKQRQIESRIDEAFYKNLFLMVAEIGDQPNITATQINTMREEKLMMLGPVLERLNDELLDPMIDRVFDIMFRRGLFPPPPPEVEGIPLRVEYISVLAQAQKAMGIGNIERYVGFVGGMADLDPSALAKLNTFETINEYADGTGVPPNLVNTNDEANEKLAAQAQISNAQQMMENAPGMAKAAKDASETEVQGESVLDRVANAQQNR